MKIPLIEACIRWADENESRIVRINYSQYPAAPESDIWLCDYEYSDAVFKVESLEDIPTEPQVVSRHNKSLMSRISEVGENG
jgi:hypothetical protein